MSNLNLNKVILGGRLTADPELKTTPSGVSVCQFGLAVNRKYSKEGEQNTDFINCVAWRATAEFISRYFHKGSSLCIVGNIQTRSYTDKDGIKRNVTEVIVDEAMFVDSKQEGQNSASEAHNASAVNGSSGYVPQAYGTGFAPSAQFEAVDVDDQLPF
jgi:single-strand DNA-binding protein